MLLQLKIYFYVVTFVDISFEIWEREIERGRTKKDPWNYSIFQRIPQKKTGINFIFK